VIPQLQLHPTPVIWDGNQGILDENAVLIADETGHALQADTGDSRPTAPPVLGLVAWFKASALNQVDGTEVNPWTDSGSNGNDMSSSDPTKTIFSAVEPLVRWTGHSSYQRYLGFGGPPNLGGVKTGCTWLYVGRRTSFHSFAAITTVIVSRLTGDGCLQETISDSTVTLAMPGLTTSIDITLGDWHVISFSYDEVEGVQRLQTNDQSASGPIAFGGAGNIPLDALDLQHEFAEAKEWLVYRQKLSDSDLYNARQYLARRHGIAAQ